GVISAVYVGNVIGPGDAEDVREVLEVLFVVGKPLTADRFLGEPQSLELRPHRAVEHENSLGQKRFEQVGFVDHARTIHATLNGLEGLKLGEFVRDDEEMTKSVSERFGPAGDIARWLD